MRQGIEGGRGRRIERKGKREQYKGEGKGGKGKVGLYWGRGYRGKGRFLEREGKIVYRGRERKIKGRLY